MGKILNALKTADGDTAELVLRCLDDDAPDFAAPAGPPAVKPAVVRLPHRVEPDPAAASLRRGAPVRTVSLRISDASPMLSPGREDRRAAEQYRVIRTRLFHQVPGPSVTVISSPGMGDGKTVSAVNLAAALALKSEHKVILVDADLRLSKVHHRLGLPAAPGLAEVLAGACPLEDALLQVGQQPNFYILPAGRASSNPSELLDSSSWPALVARFREDFHRTIVDSPPVEAVADYDLIAAVCDRVVLVVRPDHTSRPALASALAKVKGKLAGVLVNDAEDWLLWRARSSSHYYYQNGVPPQARREAGK